MHRSLGSLRCNLIGALCLLGTQCFAAEGTGAPSSATPSSTANGITLDEVVVTVPEPRYVARTTRDRIGRIWVPVYINDKGPFRLVLDTGASTSAINDAVAQTLNLPPHQSPDITLRGVTGMATVPTVTVDSLRVGDLMLRNKRLPIISDAFGGAVGVLGTEGLADKRIHIDFGSDFVLIRRSNEEPAAPEFYTIPIEFLLGKVPVAEGLMGNMRIKVIIDTGLEATVANLAARDALLRQAATGESTTDEIIGATMEVQTGERYLVPSIRMGDIVIRTPHITFGDMRIFEYWKLLDEPAILIGMDAIGTLDVLIIDYKRDELQIRTRSSVD